MTAFDPPNREAITRAAAVTLLQVAGARANYEATHIAAAIGCLRAQRRVDGGGAWPEWLNVVERAFADLGVARPHPASNGQERPEFRESSAPTDCELMPETLLSREQTARRMRCSERTVRRREAAGELPSVRHGRVVSYRAADIDAYLLQNGA